MSVLSPLAAALAQAVERHRTARIDVEDLRQAALAADLSLAGSPDARTRLADALAELELAGVVTLPVGAAGWDSWPRPRLPRWVRRRRSRAAAPAPARSVGWHARLSWVPTFLATERPTATERSLLEAVNTFLAADAEHLTVPLRERSLQLIGDEKALDALSRGRLFLPGRLSLPLLCARRITPPLLRHRVGAGPVLLLVENYATYHSLAATLPADGEVGVVAYGAGNTLGAVLTTVADEPPPALAYFGDLDLRGLEIAFAAAQSVGGLGLPPLFPAAHLYALLLDHGKPATAKRHPPAERVRRALEWLPDLLRERAGDVLGRGRRLAQEAVGLELLTRVELVTPVAARVGRDEVNGGPHVQ